MTTQKRFRTHLNHRIGDDRLVLEEYDGKFSVAYLSYEYIDGDTGEMGFQMNNSMLFDSYGEASDYFIKRRDSANPFAA